ncbi:MAG: response regulator [Spirulina sp. SIO3F2]|nr:response regulator [Spirulina sp. SIO3F2]
MLLPFSAFKSFRQSIAFRYLSIACGILVTTQVGLGLLHARHDFVQGLAQLEQKATNRTRFLSMISPEALLAMDFLALETLMRETERDRDFVYSVVLGPDGMPLTRFLDHNHPLVSRVLHSQNLLDSPNQDLTSDELLQVLEAIAANPNVEVVAEPIVSGKTFLGQVVLTYSRVNVQQDLYRSTAWSLLTALGVSGVLAAVTIFLFNRQVRRPLSQLATVAQSLTAGNLEQRVEIQFQNRDDEMGHLQQAFNTMADQLQTTLEGLQDRNKTLASTNAELARATRLKDEFLANMSHELRTPLNAVSGLSQALMDEVYGPLTERQHVSLEQILSSGEHLLSLINDILDLAKIESGKEHLQRVPLPISVLCQSCMALVRCLAEEKDIQLHVQVEVAPDWVEADERRIRQVLLNLLNNAIKFTPEGGTVTLTAEGDRAEQVLRLSVQDTGIGIAQEDMPKLFESFVQIESSLSRRYEGTGLGLALVHRLVALHSGSIAVESAVGVGSCFTVVLPWQNWARWVPETEASQPSLSTTAHVLADSGLSPLPAQSDAIAPPAGDDLILIAEDNENNVVILADYLTHKGYKLAFAKNGVEAVSLAKAQKPQLILMDIYMPRMDGLEATRWIRSDQELAEIPIIALTALAMPGDQEKCQEAGFDNYLTKPINLERLLQTIQGVLNPKHGL